MHILYIDALPDLVTALEALGHQVTVLRLSGGMTPLPWLLSRHSIQPDLVIQQEHLGRRAFLGGLEKAPCPTLFWAIDSHLNLYWQQYYALLFDGILTPHLSLFHALPRLLQPKALCRFAQWGALRPWRAHAARAHQISFCARLDANRPLRACLITLLQKYAGLHHAGNLSFQAMMELYGSSRVIPNESIANEVNFRLMEGASAGCLVLSPNVGEDQNTLLTPDSEFLIWHDGVELLHHVAWAKAHPLAAEKIGKAARLRILMEHLPTHRAKTLLNFAATLTQHRLVGQEAALAFWLTQTKLLRSGMLNLSAEEYNTHTRQGALLAHTLLESPSAQGTMLAEEAFAQVLLLKNNQDPSSQLTETLGQSWESSPSLEARLCKNMAYASAASASALQRGDFVRAHALWESVASNPLIADISTTNEVPPPAITDLLPATPLPAPPRIPVELCRAWAVLWQQAGRTVQAGFPFSPQSGMLPECAHEYLLFAQQCSPHDTSIEKYLAELLSTLPSHHILYLGHLADACLRNPSNWRIQLAFAIASLKACRVEEGMQEIEQSRLLAIKADDEGIFDKTLQIFVPSWKKTSCNSIS